MKEAIKAALFQAMLADERGEGTEYNDEIMHLLAPHVDTADLMEITSKVQARAMRHGGFPLRDDYGNDSVLSHSSASLEAARPIGSSSLRSFRPLAVFIAIVVICALGLTVRCTMRPGDTGSGGSRIGARGPDTAAAGAPLAAHVGGVATGAPGGSIVGP